MTKNMSKPKYFLEIEVAHQKHCVLLSQRKYDLYLLEETRLLGCKPASIPIKANVEFNLIAVTLLMIQEGIED